MVLWCHSRDPSCAKTRPRVEIKLLLGELFTGEAIRPYDRLVDFINGASIRLERVTGQRPSQRFFM